MILLDISLQQYLDRLFTQSNYMINDVMVVEKFN
jgi:hypothetical protein